MESQLSERRGEGERVEKGERVCVWKEVIVGEIYADVEWWLEPSHRDSTSSATDWSARVVQPRQLHVPICIPCVAVMYYF